MLDSQDLLQSQRNLLPQDWCVQVPFFRKGWASCDKSPASPHNDMSFAEQCMVWDSVQLFSLSVIDQSKICLKGILISDMWILLQNVFFLMISKGMISKGFVIMANHCSLWFKHFFIVCNFNFWGFCYRQGNFFERSFWGKFLLFCWQLTNIEVIVSPSKLRIIILMLYVMCYARKKCYILVTNTETLWHVSTCKVMRTLVF